MVATADAKRHAARIIKRLKAVYPDAHCALNFRTPLELLVATILSAQCTDTRVNIVTKDLFRKYPDARAFAAARPFELERAVQSTGFFRNKAKNIRAACGELVKQFGGHVPQDLDALVKLPGVGRKTANVVLGTAFGIPTGVVVDTHVTRLSRRLGLTTQTDPVKIERPDGTVPRRVDRFQPSHDRPRPADLPGPQTENADDLPAGDRCLPADCGVDDPSKLMILSGHQIRKSLGANIVIDPFDEANLNPNSYNLTLHNELMTYEEVVLDMAKPNRVRRITIPPGGAGARAEPALPGPHGRADRDAQPGADDRGPLVDRPAGAVRARDGRLRRRRLLRLLDAGDVRRAAGAHLPRRADLPDLLPRDQRPITEYASDKYQHNRDIQPSLLFKELNPRLGERTRS